MLDALNTWYLVDRVFYCTDSPRSQTMVGSAEGLWAPYDSAFSPPPSHFYSRLSVTTFSRKVSASSWEGVEILPETGSVPRFAPFCKGFLRFLRYKTDFQRKPRPNR